MSKKVLHLTEDDYSYTITISYQIDTEAERDVLRDFKKTLSSCIKELARRGGAHCTHLTPDETSGFILTSKEFAAANFSLDKINQIFERLDAVSTDDSSVITCRVVLSGPVLKPEDKKIALSANLEKEKDFLHRYLG
ncbi:MAG: hypothetical protein ACRCVN_06230 [Spirochaetia bacterium]